MKTGDLVKKISGMDAGLLGLVTEQPSTHRDMLEGKIKLIYVLVDHPVKPIRRWRKDKCEVVNEAR